MCQATGAAAKSESAKVGASAFEFWTALAEVETEKKQQNQPIKHYIDQCKGELLTLIFEGILAITFDEDEDDDEWGHSLSAACCLQKFALLLQNEITEPVVKFVVANISVQNWKNKYAALRALGSITEGPPKQQFSEVIVGTAPILLDLFKDQSVKVREANSWVLSRLCDHHADVLLEPTTLKSFMYQILVALKDLPKISYHCCTALEKLAIACEPTIQTQQQNPLSQYYQEVLQHLEANGERQDFQGSGVDLTLTSYMTMTSIVQNSCVVTNELTYELLIPTLQKLERTLDADLSPERASYLQDLLCGLVQVMLVKIGYKA